MQEQSPNNYLQLSYHLHNLGTFAKSAAFLPYIMIFSFQATNVSPLSPRPLKCVFLPHLTPQISYCRQAMPFSAREVSQNMLMASWKRLAALWGKPGNERKAQTLRTFELGRDCDFSFPLRKHQPKHLINSGVLSANQYLETWCKKSDLTKTIFPCKKDCSARFEGLFTLTPHLLSDHTPCTLAQIHPAQTIEDGGWTHTLETVEQQSMEPSGLEGMRCWVLDDIGWHWKLYMEATSSVMDIWLQTISMRIEELCSRPISFCLSQATLHFSFPNCLRECRMKGKFKGPTKR